MVNKNLDKIEGLKNVIINSLDNLITGDYCLLDVPNHKNIGDNLIWAGELAYLQRLKGKMLYSANMHVCNFKKIPRESIILLHGGGNFGDVWRTSQEFRNNVIKNFKHNKVIIFPQTVHYANQDLIAEDAALFSTHSDITLCARDNDSYILLNKHFSKNKILLVPDMAFFLDFSKYINLTKTGRRLWMRRTDKELNDATDKKIKENFASKSNLEMKDWPTYNHSKQYEWIYNAAEDIQNRIAKRFSQTPVIEKLIDPRFGLKSKNNLKNFIRTGIDFINEYDEVFSTRLHGAILSILLNKTVHMIDNSYGKNKNFYNTWLTDFKNTSLIAD